MSITLFILLASVWTLGTAFLFLKDNKAALEAEQDNKPMTMAEALDASGAPERAWREYEL